MLSNVVAMVTGGASGLGAAAASCLARNGARVLVSDQQKASSRFAFCKTNVTDQDDVNRALDRVEETFGMPVNAVVNCAGIAMAQTTLSKRGRRVHNLQDFSDTLHVNTVGTFNVSRLAAARMKEDGSGCIIHTASIAAFDGQIGQVAYAASKAAIVGMTLPMARELAPHKIRVMTIAPGLFETPLLQGLPDAQELGKMVPYPSRLGDPEEYGKLVVSILSNPMLNGEVIRLDGALRMPPK